MSHILIVDDDHAIRESLEMILLYEDYKVEKAKDARDALAYLNKVEGNIDVALLDIKMPGMDGLELLGKVKKDFPDIAVIMISGNAEIANAVEATKKGAYDFLEKPLDQDRVLITIRNALKNRKLHQECHTLKQIISQERQILGVSPSMVEIFNTVKRVASTEVRVLITGENGTGKELVARAIHENSSRSHNPFIEVNCAAIPESLIESELFGHEKGSFTNAYEKRKGKFEQAQEGTIFLDEIGDMSLAAQAKVLRVLEENKIERVGGNQSLDINVRVIAATNKDLAKACKDGTFREDLFYRLNVVPIALPPLRERQADISLLVSHFLVSFCQKHSLPTKKITSEAMHELQVYRWPGNVRELRNLVERLVILSDSEMITLEQVRNYLSAPSKNLEDMTSFCQTFEDFKRESEKLFLLKKLVENNWNIKKTAQVLEMQRSNLYKKIEKYGLTKAEMDEL
ncbi:MAG: sigma-54-dependent Fis family transcriptional regulator [Candidatus Brocadiae bacterium]|nr:sigma-54-dependent Fis family transcriptional regulator [Candidatus Brocadiia bacterium]